MGIPIVGKFFRPDGSLLEYIHQKPLAQWKPDFIVLHNTGSPALVERPHGFTAQHMENLADYYAGLGWHAGPHWFVDQNGCWAFSDMSAPGIHSPSWNHISWGIEMLGDYQYDAFSTGDGAKVRDNAMFLLAALHHRAGLDSRTLKLHKMDPKTTHKDCPGCHVVYADVAQRVHDLLERRAGS